MKQRIVMYMALIMLFACKKNDNKPQPAWQENTRVADRYLTRVDIADSFGVVRTETEIKAEGGNLVSVFWHKYGEMFFDGITKDNVGKVTGMMLNGQRKIAFKHDSQGRVIYKMVNWSASPDTFQATSYEYDGQGRLAHITDQTFATDIYYTGSNTNADSQVSRYNNGSVSRYVDVYTYDTHNSPFNTLPALVHYLDVNIRSSAGLSQNTITGVKRYIDGVLGSDVQYSCTYDTDGYLLMKTTNNKDTLRYYYNK